MKTSFILLFLLTSLSSTAQAPLSSSEQKKVDSLLTKLKIEKQDTAAALILMELGDVYLTNDYFRTADYTQKALDLTGRLIQDPNEKIRSAGFYIRANAFNNLGLVHRFQGNIPKALEYYSESIKLFEQIGKKAELATCLHNLGVVYSRQGEQESAVKTYERALKYHEEVNDLMGAAQDYHSIGFSLKRKKKYDEALVYYEKALTIREKIKDTSGIAASLSNIGLLYMSLNKLELARTYLKNSLALEIKHGIDRQDLGMGYNNLGNFYLKFNKPDSALYYFKIAENILLKMGAPETIGASAKGLYEVYKLKGDYKNALYYYEVHDKLFDSINNVENEKAAMKTQLKFDYEKKEALSKADTAKKELEHKAELKAQKIILYAILGGLALILFFSYSLFKRFRITKEQNRVIELQRSILEEKNKNIIDSIRYAKRIQNSLLPTEKYLSRVLGRQNKSK